MAAVVGVGECAAAARVHGDEVAVFKGSRFFLLAGGLDGDKIAVGVIVHRLGDLARQAEVVKVGGVAVFLIGADHADGPDCLARLLRHDGAGGKLPPSHIRIERRVMILRRAVRVGQDRPQAELLVQILRRVVVFLHIVRQAQGFRPAGEDIGLRAGQVDCDLLVGLAVGVSVAIDAQGVSAGDLLRQANAVAEGRTGVQRPTVVFNLHIRIAQQVQSRGCFALFQLEIVGVEAAGQAVCDHADGVAAGFRSGEADRQPRPAAVNAGGGLDIQLFGCPCRPGGRGHFQIDAVSEEAGGRGGFDIAGEGVPPVCRETVRLETRSHCGICRGRANEALLAGACARAACAE